MDIKDKDKAWTRNISQKIENISQKIDDVCQEVDDFVSMDTVKYVENQVQTFGGSVISFCSNVLQDLLPSALPNSVCHDSETVSHEGDIVAKTYKKSLVNLNENYIDTDTESLHSDLSSSAHQDVESVSEKEKCTTQDHKKSVINLIEKYADIASKHMSTECDSIHQAPPFSEINDVNRPMPMPTEDEKKLTKAICPLVKYECDLVHDNGKSSVVDDIGSEIEGVDCKDKSLSQDLTSDGIDDESLSQDLSSEINDVNRPMPMPTEDEKKLTKAICPLVKYECDLVHDNGKSSVVDYIGSEIEGVDCKDKSLSQDLSSDGINDESLSQDLSSDGINDESSLVFVTENDYHSHKITDEVVSAAVVDSVRICSSVEERTCNDCSDECHFKVLGNSQSSTVEYFFVPCGSHVAEGPLISSSSSPSNDSSYQSEFYTVPHTENFVDNHTGSVQCIYDTSDVDISTIDEVAPKRSSGHKCDHHWNPIQSKALKPVVEVGDADKFNINITDPDMETIDLSEKTKHNESSVIAEDKLLVATSSRPRRHRSYKQMIKDACTSTKRLTKEYELLGIYHGDIDTESVQHENSSILTSIDDKQLPTKDLDNSEWEIL